MYENGKGGYESIGSFKDHFDVMLAAYWEELSDEDIFLQQPG
jgi:hypothetical protein